jgi:ubiquinone/menaquinone biosynthesis C-methylase UbiE
MSIYQDKNLYSLMERYYKNYYLYDLKLPDWRRRFENNRIEEEDLLGPKVVGYFENLNLNNKKILIVGGGTGAEVFYMHNHFTNANVHVVEPFEDAIEILHVKAQLLNFPLENIKQSFAESLPFEGNFFDIVVCFTVLEHVNSVERSILEMYRVVKEKGVVMIETPNYLFPEEQHYKVTLFPPRISKTLARLNLKIYGRYTDFFESLNFFSNHDLDKLFVENDIPYVRKDQKYLKYAGWKNFIRYFPRYIFSWLFGVSRNQLIFIKKK